MDERWGGKFVSEKYRHEKWRRLDTHEKKILRSRPVMDIPIYFRGGFWKGLLALTLGSFAVYKVMKWQKSKD